MDELLGLLSVLLVGIAVSALPALPIAPRAHAEPMPGEAPSPYPNLAYFSEIDATPYALSDPPGASLPDQPGYWFTTAQGLTCGIWFRGSFGCSGAIPGAPAGIQQIGWITGDTRAHYDWTLAIRFPQGRNGTATIPPLSFIKVEGTTCATTVDLGTYCERGPFRFLISPDRTWLNG
ncbi:hypothetical protein MycrhDRAFT_0946 [Mycolicibacterium rhodesiae JS60]|nr:hypothetical protein MycrhDRAFT_0946 [Mycolicibacterium rhodesiae JS60]